MFKIFLENILIFIVLLNPISKVILLASMESEITVEKLAQISRQATVTAVSILILFAFMGLFILNSLFRIEFSSLRVVGGIVLFMVGLRALQKGEFFNSPGSPGRPRTEDMVVVPIASPLIAGPATIAAAISQSALLNLYIVSLAIIAASLINYLFMIFSFRISRVLRALHLINPLIRITGLLIASLGMDMVMSGIKDFFTGINL